MNGSDTVVLAISLQKGGVGKTTTAINLGAALAELGFRTLIIDLDPQGNASSGLGIHPPDDAPTIADVLRREETLDSIVEPTAEKNLFVAPAPTGTMSVPIPALSLRVYSCPSKVLRANSPRLISDVVGFLPSTEDRLILIIGSAIQSSHGGIYRIKLLYKSFYYL